MRLPHCFMATVGALAGLGCSGPAGTADTTATNEAIAALQDTTAEGSSVPSTMRGISAWTYDLKADVVAIRGVDDSGTVVAEVTATIDPADDAPRVTAVAYALRSGLAVDSLEALATCNGSRSLRVANGFRSMGSVRPLDAVVGRHCSSSDVDAAWLRGTR